MLLGVGLRSPTSHEVERGALLATAHSLQPRASLSHFPKSFSVSDPAPE